ncbi:short-chain dehydrogenase [Bacillus fonticola]|uniref:short-chain dehydrogenase n=1 Tax=Bacillus fonticola TaxID=2728853 RepID=UPI001476058D|nr:short-chain dehydrogenase [Bacillus fonticola]
MAHILVVGGTGMLSGVSRLLASDGHTVSVVGRSITKMNSLQSSLPPQVHIHPLLVDYNHVSKFREQIRLAIQLYGPIDCAIVWVHSYAKHTLPVLIEEVAVSSVDWELFHVVGSSTDLPSIKDELPLPTSCSYYQIKLGFIVEEKRSRWLTHAEISSGVLQSIAEKEPSYIVGTVQPWDARPQ